jgi:hypothetical protein
MTRLRSMRTICAVAIVLGMLSASAHGLAHGHHEQEANAECSICLIADGVSHGISAQPFVTGSLPLIALAALASETTPSHVSRPAPATRGPPASQ